MTVGVDIHVANDVNRRIPIITVESSVPLVSTTDISAYSEDKAASAGERFGAETIKPPTSADGHYFAPPYAASLNAEPKSLPSFLSFLPLEPNPSESSPLTPILYIMAAGDWCASKCTEAILKS